MNFSSRECGRNNMTTMDKPIAVIKVGGDMVMVESDRRGLANNVKDLLKTGWHCVLLHGGGPQLTALQEKVGLKPKKIEGRRITKMADMQVVKQALCGEVNVDLVSALLSEKIPAFGCHGASGGLIQAVKRPPMEFLGHGLVDMGQVGDVKNINGDLLNALLKEDLVPVIASLGVGEDGQVFNINADTTVAAIAQALRADLLILSTRVGGIFTDIADPSSRIPTVTPESAKRLIDKSIITDGMIPKVQESLALLNNGVKAIAIANASQHGGFLSIAQGRNDIGTRLTTD